VSANGDVLNSGFTCTACAGTSILEMGMLSRLTGNSIYEEKSRETLRSLYSRRTPIGLVGRMINIHKRNWQDETSTIGGGVDSFFEYLLKVNPASWHQI